MTSLHKYIPKHRQRVNKTLNNKFQSFHNPRQDTQNAIKHGRSIPIYLIYKKNKLLVKAYLGMEYSQLISLLYKEIIKWQYEQRSLTYNQAQIQCKKVLGFSTAQGDFKTDYLLSLKKGKIMKSLLLECFMKANKKNRVLNYEIYNCLAIGGFSKVYLSRSREDGKFYAVKFIKKCKQSNTFNEKSILNEIKIGKQISHPFLITMRESFETEGFFCMVFEYCPGGELFYLLKRIKMMEETEARFFFIQILLGIEYLHKNSILYRDLKPQNILIDHQGNSKIVDFGLSKAMGEGRNKTYSYCGSAEYMAPQMVLRCGHSYSIDYYSLGALLYQLVTGLPPFYSKDPSKLQRSIVTEQLAFPSHIILSSDLKDFLLRLLNKDQRFRLGSVAGVKEIMMHAWIGRFNREQFINKRVSPPFLPDLKAQNFDLDQLGDDEQEFTSQVIRQFSRNAKNTAKSHFKPSQQQIQHLYKSEIEEICHKYQMDNEKKNQKNFSNTQLQGHKRGMRNTNISHNSSPFRQRKSDKKINQKRSLHTLTYSQRNQSLMKSKQKQAKIRAKLFPYFVKNKVQRPKYNILNRQNGQIKRLPRANILKLSIFQNSISNQPR